MKKISVVGAIVAGALLGGFAQLASADEAAVAAGEKLYQREGCQTCHGAGAKGQGSFPSLVTSAKIKNKAEFTAIVTNGKTPMPAYAANKKVIDGIDNLLAYLNDLAAKAPK